MATERMLYFILIDGIIDEIHMGFCMGHFKLLFLKDVVPVNSVHDFVFGSFKLLVDQRMVFFLIERFIRKQVVHDMGGRKSKWAVRTQLI